MAKFLKIVSGLPRMVEVNTTIYDEVYTAPGNISAATPITLPNSGAYSSAELHVYWNGARLIEVSDYNYVGAGPTRTQISLTFDIFTGEQIRFFKDRDL